MSPQVDAGRDEGSLLDVQHLTVQFRTVAGTVRAVDDLSFQLRAGERLAIVGESGSGKSMTALSVMGLVPPPGEITSGAVNYKGRDLTLASEGQLTGIRGRRIGMVFQDPLTSLNPVYRVGSQVAGAIRAHEKVSKSVALQRALELLRRVGIPQAEQRMQDYPHRFSGGMRQRTLIAMALSGEPDLLIADEPTTALDVTVQAQILQLLVDLADERGMAVMLISHDMGVVASVTDRILVMYGGRAIESASLEAAYAAPGHPYTAALLASVPRVEASAQSRLPSIPGSPPNPEQLPEGCAFHPRCFLSGGRAVCRAEIPTLAEHGRKEHLSACHFSEELNSERLRIGLAVPLSSSEALAPVSAFESARPAQADMVSGSASSPLLAVDALVKHFRTGAGGFGRKGEVVHAIDGVSFDLRAGETLGVVGESGCGKSTLVRTVSLLQRPTSGSVRFNGIDLIRAKASTLRRIRRHMQMVFQDPFASLDPRMRVHQILTEPLRAHRLGNSTMRRKRAAQLLELVGLSARDGRRLPHAFSGGQRQRLAIARALSASPQLILCDEPVSSLDVSVRAQIINLLKDLQNEFGHAYIFISHDLAVIRHLAQRVAVMYLGQFVEIGRADSIFQAPHHPYTVALLNAVPTPAPGAGRNRAPRLLVPGEPPSPIRPPAGCRFHPRCWKAQQICSTVAPALLEHSPGHWAACHFPENTDVEPGAASALGDRGRQPE